MTTRETLIAARRLINDPNNWIKGHLAQNASGTAVDPTDESACKFCAVGAIQAASPMLDNEQWAVSEIEFVNRIALLWYNDYQSTTHQDVLVLFDKAIKNLAE